MTGEASPAPFTLRLSNFEGPFDLLLSLISKHKLDITEVALAEVTNEFIAYIGTQSPDWDLDQASSFLLVAATLLDLKTARLLPQGEVDDEDDLALLEARDLLFARLLQYRAFKEVAAWIDSVLADEGKRWARPGGLEDKFTVLLPEVEITLSLDDFARLALDAMTPAAQVEVSVEHIYRANVSVTEQANLLADRLQRLGSANFRALTADAESRLVTVARFLAILELYRSALVSFSQLDPLSDLVIRWVGPAVEEVQVSDEYDVPAQQEEGDPSDD
ncbi:MAG: segregation/condensation protein A [Propionibacteriaceae bacterium]|nr:segregation/condensation protein A [Propionibacteriaceae bacterium]